MAGGRSSCIASVNGEIAHLTWEAHCPGYGASEEILGFGSDGAPLLSYHGVDAEKTLRYVWSKPIATAVIGAHSLEELEENIRIAREFKPIDGEELTAFEQYVTETVKSSWNHSEVLGAWRQTLTGRYQADTTRGLVSET